MRTKTFTAMTEGGLDNKINKFLGFIEQRGIEVIEIKFSGSLFYIGAMIIYNEK